jgi:hypothetical protein
VRSTTTLNHCFKPCSHEGAHNGFSVLGPLFSCCIPKIYMGKRAEK